MSKIGYKKDKPKTGQRPGPRVNYDVKIGPKPGPMGVNKSGPVGLGLKCRALTQTQNQETGNPSVERN